MLVHSKFRTSNSSSSVGSDRHLYNNGDENNGNKHRVIEESFEYIFLFFFQFSGINFIENLHVYENIEEHGEMLSIFLVPVVVSNTVRYIEKRGSFE